MSLLLGYESPTNIISQMLFRARLTVSLLNAFIVRGYFLDDFLCCPLSSSLGYSWAHIADVRMALRLKTAVLGVEVKLTIRLAVARPNQLHVHVVHQRVCRAGHALHCHWGFTDPSVCCFCVRLITR